METLVVPLEKTDVLIARLDEESWLGDGLSIVGFYALTEALNALPEETQTEAHFKDSSFNALANIMGRMYGEGNGRHAVDDQELCSSLIKSTVYN